MQKHGGYCVRCDTVYDRPHDCVGITQEQRDKQKYYCVKCETEMNTVICSRCNKLRGYSIREEDVVALDAAYKYESVLSRKIWDEAIEAAAKRISELDDWFPVAEIRKLKK